MGDASCNWVYSPSEGRSGGMLSIWNKEIFKLLFSFKGRGFCGICGEWGPLKIKCFLVNIYSSCNPVEKRQLWEVLKMSKRGFERRAWCLIGDFNAIKSHGERRGATVQVNRTEIGEFSKFIEDMEVMDIPIFGRKFTWYKSDGSVMSRLDRFLVSEEWLDIWSNSYQWVFNRDFSNHCPILLKIMSSNWGPKPFRFNNCWLQHRGFGELIEKQWNGFKVEGWAAFILQEKLKKLKFFLVRWNKDDFGHLETKISELEDEIAYLDIKAESVGLGEAEIFSRRCFIAELWDKVSMKENLLCQKSRSRWLKEGDANSAFFHTCINSRRRLNNIMALQVDNGWLVKVEEVKQEILNHFSKQFSENKWDRPHLDSVSFKQLNDKDNFSLVEQFTEEEI